jgi:hypothetical protein
LSEYISKRLRLAIERRARHLCEYCLCPLAFSTDSFNVEHIIPTIKGGATRLDNLALSCSGCNSHKYDKIEAFDQENQCLAPLYNPRRERWQDHFGWNEEYTHLLGISSTGRATIAALHLNRAGVVNLRWAFFYWVCILLNTQITHEDAFSWHLCANRIAPNRLSYFYNGLNQKLVGVVPVEPIPSIIS